MVFSTLKQATLKAFLTMAVATAFIGGVQANQTVCIGDAFVKIVNQDK